MKKGQIESRIGDMHHSRELQVHEQSNGDIIVSILQDKVVIEGTVLHECAVVEFCTNGGRSPHTQEALRQLKKAIKRDNYVNPISGTKP